MDARVHPSAGIQKLSESSRANTLAAATSFADPRRGRLGVPVGRARATTDVRTRRACCADALPTALCPARTYFTTRTTPTH